MKRNITFPVYTAVCVQLEYGTLKFSVIQTFICTTLDYPVLPDNAYLSLGKRLHFPGPTLPVIAVATSQVDAAVLLFVEEVCQVLRFQTNSVPRYQ